MFTVARGLDGSELSEVELNEFIGWCDDVRFRVENDVEQMTPPGPPPEGAYSPYLKEMPWKYKQRWPDIGFGDLSIEQRRFVREVLMEARTDAQLRVEESVIQKALDCFWDSFGKPE